MRNLRVRNAATALFGAAVIVLGVGLTAPAQAGPSAKVLTAASLTGPASGAYGSTIWLRGTLWRYGTSAKIGGATVYLQRSPRGRNTWVNLASMATNSAGGYAFHVVQVGAFDYRARYYGSATYTGALSRVHYPVTTQKVLFDTISTTNHTTGTIRATGRVYPAPPSRTPVLLYRWDGPARKWIGIATGYTSGSAVTVNATRPASVTSYELVVAARAPWGAGISAVRSFSHYVWRGMFTRPPNGSTGDGRYIVLPPNVSPGRSAVNLEVGQGTYIFAMNTTGCRRFVAVTRPQQLPTRMHLQWDSDRALSQFTLEPSSPPVRTEFDLFPSETELRLWMMQALGPPPTTAYLGSDIRVLCNN